MRDQELGLAEMPVALSVVIDSIPVHRRANGGVWVVTGVGAYWFEERDAEELEDDTDEADFDTEEVEEVESEPDADDECSFADRDPWGGRGLREPTESVTITDREATRRVLLDLGFPQVVRAREVRAMATADYHTEMRYLTTIHVVGFAAENGFAYLYGTGIDDEEMLLLKERSGSFPVRSARSLCNLKQLRAAVRSVVDDVAWDFQFTPTVKMHDLELDS